MKTFQQKFHELPWGAQFTDGQTENLLVKINNDEFRYEASPNSKPIDIKYVHSGSELIVVSPKTEKKNLPHWEYSDYLQGFERTTGVQGEMSIENGVLIFRNAEGKIFLAQGVGTWASVYEIEV